MCSVEVVRYNGNMTNTKHRQGTVSELLAASYFVQKGCIVSSPIDRHGEYDLVVDDGRKMRRIQVKTIYWDRSKNRFLISCVTSHIRGNGRRTNKKYSDNSIDTLVGVEHESGAIYEIPYEKISGRRSITVYPKEKPETVNKRYQDYEGYRMR